MLVLSLKIFNFNL